jgi:hypothetical protein
MVNLDDARRHDNDYWRYNPSRRHQRDKAAAQLIIGRTITGVGNGIVGSTHPHTINFPRADSVKQNTSTIPTYQAECSRSTNRGLLICIEGGVIAFGTMIAYLVDYGASYGSDNFT